MKNIFSGDSRIKLMSGLMLVVIIPLWLIGWVLSCIGSLQPTSRKQLQKKHVVTKIPDKSKPVKVESQILA